MNDSFFNGNHALYRMSKLFFGDRLIARIIFTALLGSLLLMPPAQAGESRIDIVETWVEDGFLFHIAFEAQPTNANCSLDGEGLIEFEVVYDAQNSSGARSVFGLAIWYPGSDANDWIETQGAAIGPQSLCTTFSPCQIQQVNIVNAWCPVNGSRFLQ